jgi:DNA-binding response OmpR family regulator
MGPACCSSSLRSIPCFRIPNFPCYNPKGRKASVMAEPRNVLIIDDDAALLSHVAGILGEAGFVHLEARNGLDGLKYLNDSHVDMVILDVNMPVMDGLQTCRMIRAIEKYKDVPILMLTARGDITDMMEARKMGADDYMVKPVESELLIRKIERLFAR